MSKFKILTLVLVLLALITGGFAYKYIKENEG